MLAIHRKYLGNPSVFATLRLSDKDSQVSQQPHNKRETIVGRMVPDRPRVSRNIAVIATSALIAAGIATGAGYSASASIQNLPSQGPAVGTVVPAGHYIVRLAAPPTASYTGGVAGLAATAPRIGSQLDAHSAASQAYSSFLKKQQNALLSTLGAKADYNYTFAFDGFAATLTSKQATALSNTAGVATIERDSMKQITAESSTDFMGLSGDKGVWNAVGGIDAAGKGAVIGVLDTGIAPENPSFAGSPLGTVAGADPYYATPATISYVKGDGNTFSGLCQVGAEFALTDCTTKIVGARMFPSGFAIAGGTPVSGEYLSPRDGNDHGSHTASTAAGDNGVSAIVEGKDYGHISGVAPAAKIAAYKVCWTGAAVSGCMTTDTVAAIDQATQDGVDVLSFSIGGGAATTTDSSTGEAFLGAAKAGIFVSAAAGNAGPGASTLDNASPWLTTVAASSIPSYEATVELGNGEKYAGASITVDAPVSGTLITASNATPAGTATPTLCQANTLTPALVAGKIVVCERGVNARADKSIEVKRAGGIGMILVNVAPSDVDLDTHTVPTVHVDGMYHDAIWNYASTAGSTATLVEGNKTSFTPPTPQIAGFSSRGPVLADGSDLLKPDIAAPGVAILAASANADNAAPTWMFMSGTSMATPHIAGVALLYLGFHPTASPSEVKSAMMTSAYNTLDGDGTPISDPFAQGAGQVDPTKFFSAGLLYLNGAADWDSYKKGTGYTVDDPNTVAVDASELNLASLAIGSLTAPETLTRTVTSTQAGTFTATVNGMNGIVTTVSPTTLTFGAAGESQSYTVTFDRAQAPDNVWVTGSLDWRSDRHSGSVLVHSPMAVQPVAAQPAAPSKTILDDPRIPASNNNALVNWMMR